AARPMAAQLQERDGSMKSAAVGRGANVLVSMASSSMRGLRSRSVLGPVRVRLNTYTMSAFDHHFAAGTAAPLLPFTPGNGGVIREQQLSIQTGQTGQFADCT